MTVQQRHPWLNVTCSKFHRMSRGRAAEHLLINGNIPERGAAIELPTWVWVVPSERVGRKRVSRDGSGDILLLPARIRWVDSMSAVILRTGSNTSLAWSATAVGHSTVGRTAVAVGGRARPTPEVSPSGIPTVISTRSVRRSEIRRTLNEWAEDGRRAHWELILQLEPYVEKAAHNAVSIVGRECDALLGRPVDTERPSVVDQVTVESICTTLLYGAPDTGKLPAVGRMLERCLRPATFNKVDPERYIRITLGVAAMDELRRVIDDPHIGPKVRSVYRSMPDGVSLDDLITEYNVRYPTDRLSFGRAVKALEMIVPPRNEHLDERTDHSPVTEDFVDSLVDNVSVTGSRVGVMVGASSNESSL